MKRNLVYLTAILACVAIFFSYTFVVKSRTDEKPPVISFAEELPAVSAQEVKSAFLQGVTARDAVDGDVTDSLVVVSIRHSDTEGMVQVTYAAFDAAGNVAQAVCERAYTDYESPRFSLNTSLTFSQNSNFDIFSYVHAQDMLDGDISHRIRIRSLDNKAITEIGVHEVELKTTNSLGETVCLVVPVEVYDAGAYDAVLTLRQYLVYLPANGALDINGYLQMYTRGGVKVPLEEGLPKGFSLDVKSNIQYGVPGVYTVEYRVTQTVGTGDNAQNYTGYAKLIVVVEG